MDALHQHFVCLGQMPHIEQSDKLCEYGESGGVMRLPKEATMQVIADGKASLRNHGTFPQ